MLSTLELIYKTCLNFFEELGYKLPVLQEILSGTWNKEAELTQLKTDLAAIDRRILLSITPESGGTEEGKAVEQVTPMAQEQHDTPEKQEVKSGVKFKI